MNLDKLQGYKTYFAYGGLVLWVLLYVKIPGAKDAIGVDNFGLVLAALITAAGISQRAAVAKAHDSLEDLHEKVDAPKAGS